ncbi:MAG: hypothetical protein HUU27_07895 [Phycisphaerae bacterium]|nr:hypothetical protein [Phycisphaerae bacterium]
MNATGASSLDRCHARALDALRTARCAEGFWEGRLASSPLATAVACCALANEKEAGADLAAAHAYLKATQHADGGWGDTARSKSNLAATLLVLCADRMAPFLNDGARAKGEAWVEKAGGLRDGLKRVYGSDLTFQVPIRMTAAAAGMLPWREVDALPFELALAPRTLMGVLGLPVVSYALPALVCVGLSRHAQAPSWFLPARALRAAAAGRALDLARMMQPESGGYLEAVPITAFCLLGLKAAGRGDHDVARNARRFLRATQRSDGSWPVEVNLSVWNTTRAVEALAAGGAPAGEILGRTRAWLLAQQVTVTAPQTFGASSFARWRLDGAAQPAGQTSLTVTMSADRVAVAEYVPALSVNAGADRVIVPGESVQLNAVASNGTPPYEYAWTPTAGLSSATIANPVAAPSQTTAYTVAVTDALGHVGIDTVVVSVAPSLSVDAGPDRAALAGQAVSLFVNVSGGEPPYTYDWSPPLSQPGAIMQVFTARVSQTTEFRLTVTDAGGRVASDHVTVQVMPPLTANAGPDVTIGPGERVDLVADVQGGLPPYSLGWRAGSGPTESQAQVFTVSPARTTTYTLTVGDASGQHAQDTIVVSVGTPFSATASAVPASIPRGGKSRLLAVASGGQHPYTYEWTPTAGLSAPTAAATDARPGETTTYRVAVTDAAGRTAESAVELVVDSDTLVSPGLVGAAGLCGFGGFLSLPAGLLGLGLARRVRSRR